MLRIGLIGDYSQEVKAHIAIPLAIGLAAHELGLEAEVEWIATPLLMPNSADKLEGYSGLWAVPATPYASMEGALDGIKFAREKRVPLIGSCGGYQHMLIEFARNVIGLTEADHAESNPDAEVPVVTPLSCSVSELTHHFSLVDGSKIASIYGKKEITEQYGICNYGLNAEYRKLFERNGFRITGFDSNGEPRIAELDGYPFYIGTLFQPERSAFKERAHPLIKAFLQAASEYE